MNKVQLVGRFVAEPSITQRGSEYLKCSIAINKRVKGDTITQFVPLTFFGSQAELVDTHFSKGDVIGVSGEYSASSFVKDGETKYTHSIIVNEIYFIPTNR